VAKPYVVGVGDDTVG